MGTLQRWSHAISVTGLTIHQQSVMSSSVVINNFCMPYQGHLAAAMECQKPLNYSIFILFFLCWVSSFLHALICLNYDINCSWVFNPELLTLDHMFYSLCDPANFDV
jgi:hypothetical protein